MKISEREVTLDSITTGQQVLQINGIFCVIPKGMKVIDMNRLTPYILGHLTPAYTFNQKIRMNDDLIPLIPLETFVHECVHGFQERRMGKFSYWSTYIWQIFISIFRAGPAHIHDDHLMEREARTIAKEVMIKFDFVEKIMDIEKEIKSITGWV